MQTDSANSSYAFVLPRYGTDIGGGAETLARELAERLSNRGDRVEVWTTCARDNRTWSNELDEGSFLESGVTVRRFKVDSRDLDKWVPLQIKISEGMSLDLADELDWMEESVNSSGLYNHIIHNADEQRAIFFGPYLFGTTFWGSQLRPDKSILIPCLHDESYAYTKVIQSMFRQVKGCLFNALPEQELSRAIYGNVSGGEVGMGFVAPNRDEIESLEPYSGFDFPYILYVGRKETGKNVHFLVDSFIAGKESGTIAAEVKLVVAGGGSFDDLGRPDALQRADIVDIGYVSEVEKKQLIRHSVFLCQPSTNESFSIVLMEAWLLRVPVVVHGSCSVTRYHAVSSGGGLYFTKEEEFQAVVSELYKNDNLRNRLAASGETYVKDVYAWETVLQRFDKAMELIGD